MNLYAESSSVLAWLLDESRAVEIHALLTASTLVISSDLTLVEVDRALIRAVELRELSEADALLRSERFAEIALRWTITRIEDDVISRARERFPNEPVRALDALHLASMVMAQLSVPNLAVLSLDGVVRENARALGFEVLPPRESSRRP